MTTPPDLSALSGELFRIDWNRHSAHQQQTMYDACARATLTQSPLYAAAAAEVNGTASDFGLIRFQGQPVGMAIVARRRTFGRGAACSLFRGPLWVYDEMPREMLKLVLRQLRRRYRWWRGQPLTFHPELADSPEHRRALRDSGFRRVAEGYATVWLDLSQPLESLRAGLRPQWRNKLVQAESRAIEVVAAGDEEFLWLCDRHAEHMAEHGYRGPAPALLRALRAHAPADRPPLLLVARHDGAPAAGVFIIVHGNAATYLVGWTGDDGRRLHTHNLLLWSAVERLKRSGIRWFDLGGISADAPGVGHFKRGLGGELVTLVGGYV